MSITVKIVTPQRIAYEGSADSVRVPGWLGEYGVLEHHASMLTLSQPGVLSLANGSETTRFVVDRGFVEVGPKDISVMVQQCVRVDQIDKEEVQKILDKSLAELSSLSTNAPTYEALRKKVEYTRVLARA